MARSAGLGFWINNPHEVVGCGPNPPEVPPCPRGTLFSSNVAPPPRREVRGHHLLLRPKDNEHIIAFHLWKALNNSVVSDILHEPRE